MSPSKANKSSSRKRGLGRGLNALFEDEEAGEAIRAEVSEFNSGDYQEKTDAPTNLESHASNSSRKVLGVDQLYPCPTQPRKFFNDASLKDLAHSIAEHGLLQPILVRQNKEDPTSYEIIAGERRWRAAQRAKIHEVPVIIRDLDDAAAFQISLVENLQRQDLNPIEEAEGYHRLIEEFDHNAESVGEVLGRSRSHVSNMIRLLQLPKSIQNQLVEGKLTQGHARALINVDNASEIAQQVVSQNLSVRQTEKLAAKTQTRKDAVRHKGRGSKKGFARKDADTLALENELSQKLGLRVSIDMADQQAGKMTISFKNLDQLDDVLKRLS